MWKKVALAAGNLVCLAAILISALIGWTVLTTPKGQAPSLFGYSFMTVLTGSMEPNIPTGSLLVVKQVDAQTLEKGDIISFYTTLGGYDSMINTHRIDEVLTGSGELSFRTRGDANSAADPSPVTASQLIGQVIAVSHGFGVAISFLRHQAVFLVLVLVPLLVILVTYIRRLVRLAKEEIAQAEEELTQTELSASAPPTPPPTEEKPQDE
ncbi:MAG: signal peptidase I [Oscillospiraceae bacterium]